MRINGEEVYSKLATGEFPQDEAILEEVGRRLTMGGLAQPERVADVTPH